MNAYIPKFIIILLALIALLGAGTAVEERPRLDVESKMIKVMRVIDGDTIELENTQRVRYIGIDAPETRNPRKQVECFALEAAKKNRELVEGKEARLEKDISERDRYGRLLRYVYVGDTFVNLELVKQGFAQVSTFPPDVKYQNQFIEAQKEARKAGRGLWGRCPAGQKL